MKILGKKDVNKGKDITKMTWMYVFCLFIAVMLVILLRLNLLFLLIIFAILGLIIERIVALLKFRRLPDDLIIMHRDCVEIKTAHNSRLIKYENIKNIVVSKYKDKVLFELNEGGKIMVKYLAPVGSIDKEILKYKEKYYKA